MKINSTFTPLAALSILLCSWNASAFTIDFIKLTENNLANGGLGESAWEVLTIPAAFEPNTFGLSITGHATDDDEEVSGTPDMQQYAYLDWNDAGLGVCKDLTSGASTGANTSSSSNSCNPAGDDNVTENEYLAFTFDQDVVVDNLWFNNNHDGGFDVPVDKINIGVGTAITDLGLGDVFVAALGVADGPNGIGSFFVQQGKTLFVQYNNQEFYVSGMAVSAVPVPAAVWLFGTALLGFVGFSRRTNLS